MAKKYCCAKCGMKLKVIQKANPREGTVLNLVIPHECKEILGKQSILVIDDKASADEDTFTKVESSGAFEILDKENEKKLDKKIDKLFNELPFVKKLNKATAEHETVTQESGDKREKEHLRKELVTSSAPLNVLDMAARSKEEL